MQHATFKPYLVNAFYSWCMDIGYTPLVKVQKSTFNHLPEHLKEQTEVIFNIHPKATRNFIFSKNKIEFEIMCDGIVFQVSLDYRTISRIYTRENHFGVDFDLELDESDASINTLTDNELRKSRFIVIKNNLEKES